MANILSMKGGAVSAFASVMSPLTIPGTCNMRFLTRDLELRQRGCWSAYVRQEEDLTLNVSTAPDNSWQSWLPDEIAVDARHGGVDLSWYQGHRIGKKGWRWDLNLTPIQLNHSGASRDDYVWFSQAEFLISWKKHGAFSAIGIGASISYSWKAWPDSKQVNVGAAMYVGLPEDKFRITIGAMSFDSGFAGGNYYFNLGVNDSPGFVYWGMPRARGSWWHSKSEW